MKCEYCDEVLTSNNLLVFHLKSSHKKSPIEYFSQFKEAYKFCSKCDKALPITNFFCDTSNNFGYRTQCIECMRPKGNRIPCPICNRIFQWTSVITHMKNEHNIAPLDSFNNYLKSKLCSKCKAVKPLSDFSRMANDDAPYYSLCKNCNFDRNINRAVADKEFSITHLLTTRLAFKDKCFICGLSHDESISSHNEPLHIDHINPHIQGGELTLDNALLLCRKCNLQKGTISLNDFMESKFSNPEVVSSHMSRLTNIHLWANKEIKRLSVWESYKSRLPSDVNPECVEFTDR